MFVQRIGLKQKEGVTLNLQSDEKAMASSIEQEDGLPSYLNRLTKVPLLTAEEETSITLAVQRGDPKARQRLIESNMRLVINIAKTYRSRTIPLEDLIQEGAIGLMHAATRFDPGKGFRFSTYATHWIRQAIGRAIDYKSKAIRLPAHVSQSLRRIERERLRMSREMGMDPTSDQLANALGISSKKLSALIQSSHDLLSLDMSVGDGYGTTLGGLIRDERADDPEESVVSSELVAELAEIICELNEREQKVMRLRFQMDGTPFGIEEQELADELNISRERVRQIEIQAIKKLRMLASRRRMKESPADEF